MSKKLTYEYVKTEFKKEGYELLEKEYKNARTKMKIKCPEGHIVEMIWDSFQRGHRCKECYYEKTRNPYKYDLKQAIEIFKKKGLELMESEYINVSTKMRYICKKHNNITQETTLSQLVHQDQGCRLCGIENMKEKQRLDEEFVFNEFLKKGLIVLEKEKYINTHTEVAFICKEHPDEIQYITYHNLQSVNLPCSYCQREYYRGENHWNWKGGLTSENMLIRNSNEYSEWRQAVFERDDFTCQCCNDNKTTQLRAHHIKNFADNERLRLKINNGVTLCDKCHDLKYENSFHRVYGTKNNSQEELNEYIKWRCSNNEHNKLLQLSDCYQLASRR